MSDSSNFTKLVPGFDFLQNLVKGAGAAMPAIGQWVAPTLDPKEIDKRIEELRTVQFWLEQNARMIGATIQALEVQRMTLSTLQTMNVQMGDLRESLKIRMPDVPPPRQAKAEPAPEPEPATPRPAPAAASPSEGEGDGTPAAGMVDPMQWWGALTKQFTELATTAMKDTAADAAKSLAGAMAKPPFDLTATPAKAVPKAAGVAAGSAAAAKRRPPAAKKPQAAAKPAPKT